MGDQATMLRQVPTGWCSLCHVPVADATCSSCGRGIGRLLSTGRLRPVFSQEIVLMQGFIGETLMSSPRDLVLWRSGRDYYVAGRKVFRLTGGNCTEPPRLVVHDTELFRSLRGNNRGRRPNWLRRDPSVTRNLIASANALRLVRQEEEAICFLRQVRARYPDMPLAVSWSGGKDSTVVSMLAQNAFPGERIPHVFADTTMELPSTYEFLQEFRKANPAVPFLVGVPSRDFFELCREIGPPSRIQRWCCTTHKAAPLAEVFRAVGGNGKVLAIGGLRRNESIRRQAYKRVIIDGKIGPQVLVSPIADWSDFDVWARILADNLIVNDTYRSGLDRIGCAFCPNSCEWSNMIGSLVFSNYFRPWFELLTQMAGKAGIQAPEEYVRSNAWKNRLGGGMGAEGLSDSYKYNISTLPCQSDEHSTIYKLATHFDLLTLKELLKPFGHVSADLHIGNIGHYQVVGPHGNFAIRAVPQRQHIRATFENGLVRKRLEGALRLQFRKLQACVGCGGCAAICASGAIVRVGPDYAILQEQCTHCLQCIRKIRAGCIAAHSLNRKMVSLSG